MRGGASGQAVGTSAGGSSGAAQGYVAGVDPYFKGASRPTDLLDFINSKASNDQFYWSSDLVKESSGYDPRAWSPVKMAESVRTTPYLTSAASNLSLASDFVRVERFAPAFFNSLMHLGTDDFCYVDFYESPLQVVRYKGKPVLVVSGLGLVKSYERTMVDTGVRARDVVARNVLPVLDSVDGHFGSAGMGYYAIMVTYGLRMSSSTLAVGDRETVTGVFPVQVAQAFRAGRLSTADLMGRSEFFVVHSDETRGIRP